MPDIKATILKIRDQEEKILELEAVLKNAKDEYQDMRHRLIGDLEDMSPALEEREEHEGLSDYQIIEIAREILEALEGSR